MEGPGRACSQVLLGPPNPGWSGSYGAPWERTEPTCRDPQGAPHPQIHKPSLRNPPSSIAEEPHVWPWPGQWLSLRAPAFRAQAAGGGDTRAGRDLGASPSLTGQLGAFVTSPDVGVTHGFAGARGHGRAPHSRCSTRTGTPRPPGAQEPRQHLWPGGRGQPRSGSRGGQPGEMDGPAGGALEEEPPVRPQ